MVEDGKMRLREMQQGISSYKDLRTINPLHYPKNTNWIINRWLFLHDLERKKPLLFEENNYSLELIYLEIYYKPIANEAFIHDFENVRSVKYLDT